VKEHHSKIAPVVIPQSAEAVEEKIILPLVSKETGVSYELDARIDLTDINGSSGQQGPRAQPKPE